MNERLRYFLLFIFLGILGGLVIFRLASEGKLPIKVDQKLLPKIENTQTRTVVQEENAVISTVEKTSPSVIAIGVNQRIINPFDPFSTPTTRNATIGTGFVVSEKGIIVTNKHVVSDSNIKYSVVTKDG